jgi:hypothetical protein
VANLIELDTSGSIDIDAANKAASVRIFYSSLSTPEAATAAFYNEIGSGPHPTNPSLRFDRVSIVPEDRGSGYRLTASYTTFGGGRFNTREQPEGYWFKWRYSNVSVTTEIPANVREQRIVKSGDTEDVVDVWVSASLPIQEYRTVWIFQAYTQVSDYRSFRVITNQLGKVHTFGGVLARFASGTARDDDKRPGWYTVEYNWEVDAGTPRPTNQENFGERYLILDPNNRPVSAGFYRLPYESFVTIPSTSPAVEPHAHIAVQTYARDPDGWRSLPGTEGIQ